MRYAQGYLVVGLLLAGLQAMGCIDVKVDTDEGIYRVQSWPWDSDEQYARDEEGRRFRKISKGDAYEIAKSVARDRGIRWFGNYHRNDRQWKDSYWVLFDHRREPFRLGYPSHFTVHVLADGSAVFYDVAQTDDLAYKALGGEEVDEDAAKAIARRMVKEQGLRPGLYNVQEKGVDKVRWITFDDPARRYTPGWPHHVIVLVLPNGRAGLYKPVK
jgi:hypothetical protein